MTVFLFRIVSTNIVDLIGLYLFVLTFSFSLFSLVASAQPLSFLMSLDTMDSGTSCQYGDPLLDN